MNRGPSRRILVMCKDRRCRHFTIYCLDGGDDAGCSSGDNTFRMAGGTVVAFWRFWRRMVEAKTWWACSHEARRAERWFATFVRSLMGKESLHMCFSIAAIDHGTAPIFHQARRDNLTEVRSRDNVTFPIVSDKLLLERQHESF